MGHKTKFMKWIVETLPSHHVSFLFVFLLMSLVEMQDSTQPVWKQYSKEDGGGGGGGGRGEALFLFCL